MKRTYEVRDRADKRAIREFLKREGQFLLPLLELVEQTEVVIDEVIQVMGRATIEAVLEMSAEGVAGVKQAGRSRAEDDTVWYGRQGGVVYLSDRKVRVERPRLRRRGAGEGGEVEVPAYAAMRRPGAVADRMLEVLMAGVSTRKYGRVIGEMADTVGVSKSAVSRETVEASERVLKELMERRLDAWDLLVIYLDGIQMGSHHVLAAVGVDSDGKKHVLGVREGASENAEVTSALLEDLVERGLDPGRRRLFVIDGSKALRKAIEKVFGQRHPIQRCRNHKLRNVLGHLPKDQHPQVKAAFRAAMKLDAKQGEQKLEQLARWLERDHPSASASLREGLSEMFTINRLGLPPRLRKCLGSTNLIDSTHSGVRQKTRRVTNWKNGAMALRWAAASFVETEKSYRRIIGYDQLWMLRAHLDDHEPVAEMRKAGQQGDSPEPPPSTVSGTPSGRRSGPPRGAAAPSAGEGRSPRGIARGARGARTRRPAAALPCAPSVRARRSRRGPRAPSRRRARRHTGTTFPAMWARRGPTPRPNRPAGLERPCGPAGPRPATTPRRPRPGLRGRRAARSGSQDAPVHPPPAAIGQQMSAPAVSLSASLRCWTETELLASPAILCLTRTPAEGRAVEVGRGSWPRE